LTIESNLKHILSIRKLADIPRLLDDPLLCIGGLLSIKVKLSDFLPRGDSFLNILRLVRLLIESDTLQNWGGSQIVLTKAINFSY
jgi:hypothetical protein